jgi:oxalate decarboxylase family bicupin protein
VLTAAAAGTVVTASIAANAQTFGNPDLPPQGAINTRDNPASATDPGPQNPALASQFPDAFSPPPTDVGDMPMFWASFNNAPRRIQNGGWARQVTQADFQIAEEISGVNMRLTRGAIRELHWHQAAEWGFVSRGAVRVTTIDTEGRSNVEDIGEGGLWYFASGLPHSLQGIGEDGAEFILAFDNGAPNRVQHASALGLDGTYPARHIGVEFRVAGRHVCKNSATPALYFSRTDARAIGRRAGAGGRCRRQNTESIDLCIEQHAAHQKDRGRRGAHRR